MHLTLTAIAKTAITIFYFAFAKYFAASQKKLAFQASSPIKLSKGRLFATGPLFLPFRVKALATVARLSYVGSSAKKGRSYG